MILYKTNGNWFGDIAHLWRSYTMTRIVKWVFYIGLYTAVTVFLLIRVERLAIAQVDTTIYTLLGLVLSILLVFRTNTAYDRWWEGRKQWGALVNNARNLAVYVHGAFPRRDEDVRRFFAKQISNFCLAFVEHLRDGVQLDALIYLSPEERERFGAAGHVPNLIVRRMYERLSQAHEAGDLSNADFINLGPLHKSFLDILGACERIKKTPIPFSYAVYLKIFITVYCASLPFALVEAFGWLTIPVAMFITFALLGVELLGEEIEDPFGLDCNDLPTGDIAHTIKKNVFEILEDRVTAEGMEAELYEKVF